MINDAIQAVVSAVIPNTFQSIGDEKIPVPYCIHESTDNPEYLKEGLSGYEWTTEIGIIHSTADAAESLAVNVIAAMEALGGTTRNSTIIETVQYMGSEPGFNEQTREYLKLLRFIINTKNR
jgi:hypothetical protein